MNDAGKRRHLLAWKALRPLAKVIMAEKFNFHPEETDLQGPLFILANHNSDWDPGFVVSAFKPQVYFVASEHLLRLGAVSTALSWLQAPIARQKAGNAAGTVMEILRRLKNGSNVCLFPEGNRSWDGVTMPFPPATGKLAKISCATLVTYHTQGAYFANPRWAGPSLRKGEVRGNVAGVYPPEVLKTMTAEEINGAIARDLYEDAWQRQRTERISFQGKRLAEHLETLLFTCPRCGGMHCMESRDDRFYCRDCGYEVQFLPTGFFGGRDLIFDNIRDWNRWQSEKIKELCATAGEGPIFSDSGMELFEVTTGRGAKKLGEGFLRLYRDRIELPNGEALAINKISGMALRGPQDLFVGAGERHYQLCSDCVRNTEKYLTACISLGTPAALGV